MKTLCDSGQRVMIKEHRPDGGLVKKVPWVPVEVNPTTSQAHRTWPLLNFMNALSMYPS